MGNSKHGKNIFFVLTICTFLLLQFNSLIFAADTDKIPEGYISSIINTSYGVVFSDEYSSTLYLSNNGKIEKLYSAPGCGRYISTNKDGNLIGFKNINALTGLQAPAIYDLKNRKVTLLEQPTKNAGQVSFDNNGSIAYTYENSLVILKNSAKKSIDLGQYSNRAPISPDGSKAIYRDNNDQLWVIDLGSLNKSIITDSKDGYANAAWSPDSKSIVYTTNGIKIYSTDLVSGKTYFIAEGENPSFLSDSKQIVFFNKEIDYNKVKLINSDIYIADAKGGNIINITNTADAFEMDPVFDAASNKVLYHTFSGRQVVSFNADASRNSKEAVAVLKLSEPLKVEFFTKEMSLQKPDGIQAEPNYVHIHQVYDTREDWGEGRSCCGATSCMEAIASYGLLPAAPFTTYSHTSNYGKYISDPYSFAGYNFTGYVGWPSGGHGYLWNGSGSPYSNAVSYLQRHGIASYRDENVSFSTVTNELAQKYPYIVCSTGLTAGHIVMVVGQYGTGHTLYCNDPYGDKNVGSYGYIRNGKNAIYDWSDVNTGHEKVTPVVWAVTARCNPNVVPTISSTWPLNNATEIKNVDTISIKFNQIMDKANVESYFSISPAVTGTIFWTNDDQTLNFKPTVPMNRLTKYTVTLGRAAKNIFGKSFDNDIVFSFTTRSRYKLSVEKSYPSANQSQISSTVQFKVQFDAPVLYSGLIGKVELYNSKDEKLSLGSVKVSTIDGKGVVFFEAKSPLAPNTIHYILLNSKICDAEGIPLTENIKIQFVSDAERYQSGTVIDDFENIDNWAIQKPASGSTGIDTNSTSVTLASDRKVNGSSSAKAAYMFSSTNGVCKISNLKKPTVGSSSTSEFGIWVFGDLSGNVLEYWFNVNGSDVKAVVDTLNWTGWKLKRIKLSSISGTGTKLFSGISISQTAEGAKSGAIYFDDAQYDMVLAVNSKENNIANMNYSLNQNYPNPFNPSTSISYSLGTTGKVQLKIYDMLGKEIATLVDEVQTSGSHSVEFNKPLSSGVYYYTLRAGEFTSTRKMIILK